MWGGGRGSNPGLGLHRPLGYHYLTPATGAFSFGVDKKLTFVRAFLQLLYGGVYF